jgi:hypothetical protein
MYFGKPNSGHDNPLVYGCYLLRYISLSQSATFCNVKQEARQLLRMAYCLHLHNRIVSAVCGMLHAGLLFGLFFYLEDGGRMLLWNIGRILLPYKAFHHRRWYSSVTTVTTLNTIPGSISLRKSSLSFGFSDSLDIQHRYFPSPARNRKLMIQRNRARPVRKADIRTANSEPIFYTMRDP